MFAARVIVAFRLAVSLIYVVFAGSLTGMFMKNEVIMDYGARFLRGFCLGLPFLCVDFLAVGVFQAVGMAAVLVLVRLFRKMDKADSGA